MSTLPEVFTEQLKVDGQVFDVVDIKEFDEEGHKEHKPTGQSDSGPNTKPRQYKD